MTVYTLTDIVTARLQVISFFLVLSVVMAAVFQYCWNRLAKDFPRLPVLSGKQSLAVIFVASLFCGLILTMISGARELMTPGAWDKVGTGYKLREPKQEPMVWLDSTRRRGLEQFRDALWAHARAHGGKLPDDPDDAGIPETVRRSPDLSGTPYGYLLRKGRGIKFPESGTGSAGGAEPDSGIYVLAHEPMTFGPERFVLLSSGEVVKMKVHELTQRVAADNEVDSKARQLNPPKA